MFTFSGKQRQVIKALWAAWEDGSHDVPQAELLAAADSDCTRLRDLFSRHPAWGTLIVRGSQAGTHRLRRYLTMKLTLTSIPTKKETDHDNTPCEDTRGPFDLESTLCFSVHCKGMLAERRE